MFNIIFNNSTDIINKSRKKFEYNIYPLYKERYSFYKNTSFNEYNGKHHFDNLTNIIKKENL